MGIRIVVCIDLPSDDPAEAYRMLNELLMNSGGLSLVQGMSNISVKWGKLGNLEHWVD